MRTETIIIGAGQAGLAMSACLGRLGIDHVLLERGRVGERWFSERWPSLRLLTPTWMTRLPGLPAHGAQPDGFMRGIEFARLLSRYRDAIGAPVVGESGVRAVDRAGPGFRVRTARGEWLCRAVVVATGACDTPHLPAWATELPPAVRQVTPSAYRGPEGLPPGGVLVIGASATGVQLAREIRRSGRAVTLAVGRHVRTPRHYRGQDLFHWLDRSGFLAEPRPFDVPPETLRRQPSLQLVGSTDGAPLDLTSLAAAGVQLTGRALGCAAGRVQFAQTLPQEQGAAEARRQTLLHRIDTHIAALALSVDPEPEAWRTPATLAPGPATLDLRQEGIGAVVWATGYRRHYPWLRLPVLDAAGEIVTEGGVTREPGLFVLGLPFMRHRASAFIDGVGRDAEALAPLIHRHLAGRSQRAA